MRLPRTSEFVEKGFVVLSFCLFSGVATFLFVHDNQLSLEARGPLRLLFIPVYASTVVLIGRRAEVIAQVARMNWHLVAALLVIALSVLWSIAPEISARRLVGLIFTSLFAVYLFGRYDLPTLLRLLAAAHGGIIVVSFALVLLAPAIGIDPVDGKSWRGVFTQKNSLGQSVMIAILAFALIETHSARQQALRCIALLSALIMLWFSGSRTPLVCLVALVPLSVVIWSFRFPIVATAAVSLMTLMATYLAGATTLLYASDVLALLGKDASLTGRDALWDMAVEALWRRPLLGYGYAAFWEPTGREASSIWELVGWDAPGAHNGYIELWLGIGIAAPIILALSFYFNIKNSAVALTNGHVLEGRLCLLVTAAVFLTALSESPFFEQNDIAWVLFLIATIYVRGRPALSRRAAVSAGEYRASARVGGMHRSDRSGK
jgi:O-antigen ligase